MPPCYVSMKMDRRRPLGLVLAAVCAVAAPAHGAEEADADDPVFWSDPRGVIFSLEGAADEMDLVRLGELREQFDTGMAALDEGRWAEAAEALEEVAQELPVPAVLHAAAVAHFQLEHYHRARQLLEISLAAAPDDLRTHNLLGLVLGSLGQPGDAVVHLLASRELARQGDNVAFEAFAMLNLAQMQLELGKPDEAQELATEALAIGKVRRYGNVTAVARNTLGNLALYRGDLKGAEREYRKSLQVERRGRGNEDRGALLNNLATVEAGRGELAAARELLLEAVEVSRGVGHRAQEGGILVTLAGLDHRLGRREDAGQRLGQALAIFDDLELPRGRVEVRLQQARIARSDGRALEADEFLELARIALRDIAMPQLNAEVDLLTCEVLLDRGDPEAAAPSGEAARSWFETAQRPSDASGAALCWAEARASTGDVDEAAEAFDAALSALGATDDGTRLADAHQRSGLFELRHGDTDLGQQRLDEAARWLGAAGRHRDLAVARNLEGYELSQRDLPERALLAFERGEEAAAEADDTELVRMARGNRVQMLVQLGRLEDARALAGKGGDPEMLRRIALAGGQQAFQTGLAEMEAERWKEAAAAMQDALAQLPVDDEQVRPAAHANLRMIEHHRGLLALERGELDLAMEHMELAMDQLAASGDAAAEARLLHDLAVVRIELEDMERARGYLQQALPAAEASGDGDLLRAVFFQTGLALLEVDPASAVAALRSALAVEPAAADELSAACRYNLGILLYRDGAHGESREALEESRELYRALGRADQVAVIDGYLEEFEMLEEP